MKLLAGLIGGLVLALLASLMFSIGGGMKSSSNLAEPIVFFGVWTTGAIVALKAPSGAKAWRRVLIAAAIFSFLLPLASVVFTGSQVAQTLEQGGKHADAAAAGVVIGGGLVTGFLGLVGFFLGAVFLIIGLLVGRDKQVVYVQAPPPSKGEA